jgi:glycosyltransferase involved in cell wall biosynthesis
MTQVIKVLHMDSSIIWGGGQSQIATLIRESKDRPIEHYLASPANSKLWLKTRARIKGHFPLARAATISPLAMWRVRSYCLKHNIQIVHAHCGKSHTFAFWLKVLLLPTVKLIVHRRIPAKIRSNLLSREKFINHAVNHFITVSEFIREVLISGGVEPARITCVRSSKKPFACEPADKARARETLARTAGLAPDGDLFIVSASRLVPDKGLFVLIEAFRHLVRERPRSRLLIAGEGPLESELKIAGKALTETGQLVFLGFRKDVPELLLGSDLFAIPSLSEGLGSTIVEAMLARTTVVGSAVEGIPELIKNDINGVTVPSDDSSALFDALLSLASDKVRRQTLADHALEWAQTSCTPQIMVSKTCDVYCDVLKVQ